MAFEKPVSAKQKRPTKSQEKWYVDCSLECPFCSTKVTELIIFPFKLLHRRPATNDFLKKISLRENNICFFCGTARESLIHLCLTHNQSEFFFFLFSFFLVCVPHIIRVLSFLLWIRRQVKTLEEEVTLVGNNLRSLEVSEGEVSQKSSC